jgi:hypothetical protein
MNENITHAEAAANGARWLSEKGPAGWWERVDTATLDITDGAYCVLGQVFAKEAAECGGIHDGYLFATQYIWDDLMTATWQFEHGFITIHDDEYNELREAWIAEIEDIRALVSA